MTSPDEIIDDIGGCGKFQVRMSVIVHLTKTLFSFSVISMVVISHTPSWKCEDTILEKNYSSDKDRNETHWSVMSCYVNNTKCKHFKFEQESRYLVSEFDLVCDLDYIPSTIMSLQTFGMLIGALVAGQLSDMYGRKPPYFSSIVVVIIFNFIGFLSVNWIMFAISRTCLGIGAGMFLAINICIMSEFSPSSWRSWIVGFPSWPIQCCLFALFCWLIEDWRYIQLFCGLLGVPCLFTWFIVPESFRWYIAHDRVDDAKAVLRHMAKYNDRTLPDVDFMEKEPEKNVMAKKYTIASLFGSKELTKITLLLSVNCLTHGMVIYGITFNIQALSGNVYLNLFLFSLAGIPTKLITMWLQNRLGRRASAAICFVIIGISSLIVGIIQSTGLTHLDIVINVFAIIASMGINTAQGPIQTMVIEMYPTVIRNIGFGSLDVLARVGSMIGPQLIYLNVHVPGLFFFVCCGIVILCIITLFWLPETLNTNLSDKLETDLKEHSEEIITVIKTPDKCETIDPEESIEHDSLLTCNLDRVIDTNSHNIKPSSCSNSFFIVMSISK